MIRPYLSLVLLIVSVSLLFVTDLLQIEWGPLVIVGSVLFLLGIYFLSRNLHSLSTLLLIFSFAVLLSFQFSLRYLYHGPNHVTRVIDPRGTYRVFGKVDDWPVLKNDETEIKVAIDSIAASSGNSQVVRHVTGAILLKISDSTTKLQPEFAVQEW